MKTGFSEPLREFLKHQQGQQTALADTKLFKSQEGKESRMPFYVYMLYGL